MMLPEIVYLSCAAMSLVVCYLLFKAYRKSSNPLLLWSGISFVGFTLNNILLFVDMVLLPTTDISSIRTLPALLGLACLVYGLIWETT